MWRICFVLLLALAIAAPLLADQEKVDDTFSTVNKHLYGQGETSPGDDASPQPTGGRPAVTDADTTDPAQPAEASDDEHYIQQDDFFVSAEPQGQNSWIYVKLAKMVTPPTTKTKKEAEFYQIIDGNKLWTRHYWKTRQAGKGELKLGTVVVAFDKQGENEVYVAPESKEESRGGSWFLAKITDVSDLYKGFVTVSGNYKVNIGNLRVKQ
jgi:hypothetical protein